LIAVQLATGPAHTAVRGGEILQQSGQGGFVTLHPPPGLRVGADTFDDDNLYAFDEAQGATLQQPLRVDLGAERGTIPAGTRIDSHYVFFDSLDGSHFAVVQFETPILGIALTQATMAASDHLGHPHVTYLNPGLRGLETGDEVWIDAENPTRLFLLWAGSSPGDYIRVFTQASETAPMM
jgi:hypothetical protein